MEASLAVFIGLSVYGFSSLFVYWWFPWALAVEHWIVSIFWRPGCRQSFCWGCSLSFSFFTFLLAQKSNKSFDFALECTGNPCRQTGRNYGLIAGSALILRRCYCELGFRNSTHAACILANSLSSSCIGYCSLNIDRWALNSEHFLKSLLPAMVPPPGWGPLYTLQRLTGWNSSPYFLCQINPFLIFPTQKLTQRTTRFFCVKLFKIENVDTNFVALKTGGWIVPW